MTVSLVTGGSGYFGSTLVAHLVAHGDSVRNFDVNAPEGHPTGVEFVEGDIRDRRAIRGACEGVDVVFHNVAQVPLARNRELIDSVNIEGTANLLDAAQDAGVAKVIFTSSSAVFGVPAVNPVTEDTPPRPVELYGRAKLRGEELCRDAVGRGLDVTIIRPRTVVGHGRLGIFAILFDWVADGSDVFVMGRGDNRYQFVHARDLAEACRLAAGRSGPSVYNIGAARFGTMRETLEALVDHAGTGSRVRSLPTRPAAAAMAGLSRLHLVPFAPYHWLGYGMSLWFDITKAQQELGWQPEHSNQSMIIESYEWFLAHRAELDGGERSAHRSPVRQGMLRVMKRMAHGRRPDRR